jgi:hypothetical protein
MERNLSDFFQNLERYTDDGKVPNLASTTPETLANLFIERFPHLRSTDWIDTEIAEVFGVEPFVKPFNHHLGYQSMSHRNLRVAIARYDRLQDAFPRMARELLGAQVHHLPMRNQTQTKRVGDLFGELKQTLTMPAEAVQAIYQTRLARHYFTDAERSAAVRRWSAR